MLGMQRRMLLQRTTEAAIQMAERITALAYQHLLGASAVSVFLNEH
jgi:hypothetical protein